MADFAALDAELRSWTRTTPAPDRVRWLPIIDFRPWERELMQKLLGIQPTPSRLFVSLPRQFS